MKSKSFEMRLFKLKNHRPVLKNLEIFFFVCKISSYFSIFFYSLFFCPKFWFCVCYKFLFFNYFIHFFSL